MFQFHCFLSYLQSCVTTLDSVLSELGVREDIFSLGFTSAILASELEAFPAARNRRKVSETILQIKADL